MSFRKSEGDLLDRPANVGGIAPGHDCARQKRR